MRRQNVRGAIGQLQFSGGPEPVRFVDPFCGDFAEECLRQILLYKAVDVESREGRKLGARFAIRPSSHRTVETKAVRSKSAE
jgi:hypothetical protein